MSAGHACAACLRRSWLIWSLSGRFDLRRYDAEALGAILGLADDDLLAVLGIRRTSELADCLKRRPDPHRLAPRPRLPAPAPLLTVCRHDPFYLDGAEAGQAAAETRWGAPPVLHLAGCLAQLHEMREVPRVAIVGTRRATDYGTETARRLAADLSEVGLVVVGGLAEGVASAAHRGALERRRGLALTIAVAGLDRCSPVIKQPLYRDLLANGCAVSEMPLGARARRWCYAARNRLIAGVADVIVVVEAEDRPSDLMAARFARVLGRQVGAVPGRVTSPASRGAHDLLAEGASLVRDAGDVLDLVHAASSAVPGRKRLERGSARAAARHRAAMDRPGHGTRAPGQSEPCRTPQRRLAPEHADPGLDRSLAMLLGHLAEGCDTVERLTGHGLARDRTLLGLAELELAGLVVRGEGGRYVPRGPIAGRRSPGATAGSAGRSRAS